MSGASNRVVGDMAWVETALALFKLKKERVALSHVDMWCEKGSDLSLLLLILIKWWQISAVA